GLPAVLHDDPRDLEAARRCDRARTRATAAQGVGVRGRRVRSDGRDGLAPLGGRRRAAHRHAAGVRGGGARIVGAAAGGAPAGARGGARVRYAMTVDEPDALAAPFEEHRDHLRGVAYRMLGSLSEAEDAVQEAWLRLHRAGASGVENLRGWLT